MITSMHSRSPQRGLPPGPFAARRCGTSGAISSHSPSSTCGILPMSMHAVRGGDHHRAAQRRGDPVLKRALTAKLKIVRDDASNEQHSRIDP